MRDSRAPDWALERSRKLDLKQLGRLLGLHRPELDGR